MWLLILDYISRKRWLLLMFLVTIIMAAMHNGSGHVALLFYVICTAGERAPGWLGVVRTLPIATRELAFARWMILFGLLPLMGFAVIPFGVFIGTSVFHGRLVDPWFSPAFGLWICLGFFAFVDVAWKVTQLVGRRFEESLSNLMKCLGRRGRIVIGVVLVFGFIGILVGLGLVLAGMGHWAPVSLAGMKLSHWIICASVPVWVAGSLLFAVVEPELHVRRAQIGAGNAVELPVSKEATTGPQGKGGMILLIRKGACVPLVLLGMQVSMLAALAWWVGQMALKKEDVPALHFMAQGFPIFVGALVSSISVGLWTSRSLRILPISTPSLASLMMSVPLLCGVVMGLFVMHGLPGRFTVGPAEAVLTGLATVAVGSVGLVIALWTPPTWLGGVMLALLAITSARVGLVAVGPAWISTIVPVMDVLLILFSFDRVCKALRQSSVLYRR